jgi:hypothetical protein
MGGRIRHLGCSAGGGPSGVAPFIVSGHREEMELHGGDWLVPWAYIAVKHRCIVAYGRDIYSPPIGDIANDL